jgi:signal transduction protein with GAF and PtsI domain
MQIKVRNDESLPLWGWRTGRLKGDQEEMIFNQLRAEKESKNVT